MLIIWLILKRPGIKTGSVICKSILARAERDLGKAQVTTPVFSTLWRLVMSNGRSFQNRLYFTVSFGAGLLLKHYYEKGKCFMATALLEVS